MYHLLNPLHIDVIITREAFIETYEGVGMFILASESPRRQQLLKKIGINFKVVVSQFDEESIKHDDPRHYVFEIAKGKALKVHASHSDDCVIAADTTVFMDGVYFNKPQNETEAIKMLSQLSGKTHQVYTGVVVKNKSKMIGYVKVSHVTFKTLSQDTIEAYVKTKEPLDKAGAYAIQGGAQSFVETVEGDIETIIGFPTTLLIEILKQV
jgi:septum formation protein